MNATKRRPKPARSTPRNDRHHSGRYREELADRMLFWAVVIDICLLAVAGGPPPAQLSTVVFVLVAVALTALLAIARSAQERQPPLPVRILLVAMVALPALQLVPLPLSLWQALPGGDLRRSVLTLVNAQGSWQPLSLVPVDTASTVLLAFCFAVLLLGMLVLRERRFEQILLVLGLVALVNIGIGILQAASGGSPHLLTKADHGALLGFFANKNHIGAAIAASLALIVCLVDLFPMLRRRKAVWLSAAILLALVCVVPTNSRAGLLLTLAVGLWIALRFVATGKPWTRLALAGGGIVLVGVLSLSPVVDSVYRRFGDVGNDLRWHFIEQSQPLVREYGLTGAGAGSFSRLFIVNERLAWVKPTIVNEAHNEYLQTVIEYGVPGIALLLAALAVVGWRGWQSWRLAESGSSTRRQLEVGAVIVLVFLLHSAIDYPLRRPASWALFAAGCALILRGGPRLPARRPGY